MTARTDHPVQGRAGRRSRPMVCVLAVVMGLPFAGLPVAAQQPFALPQGCEAYVTVQKRGCTISHLFRCEADPAGHQRRVDLDENGMTYMGVIDAETQWIESFHGGSGDTNYLAPDPVDPASFTELLATGRDGMDFQTLSDTFGATRYVGEDRLTGRSVVIDGVTLQETAFRIVVTDQAGELVWEIDGNEYIHPAWRTFLSGTRSFTTPNDAFTEDGTPVEFIFPEEDGFLGVTPRHDCGVVLSGTVAALPLVPVSFQRN